MRMNGFEFIETVQRSIEPASSSFRMIFALTAWRKASGEDLYVELTPGADLQTAVSLQPAHRIPPVATTRAAMLRPTDFEAHRLLRAIAENTTLSRLRPDCCCAPSHWLMPSSRHGSRPATCP
jgi:DNA polymerase III alpha subunit